MSLTSPPSGPQPEEPERPPVVPGYRLEALLGRGGSGEVWRAVPRGGGSPVAVKVLRAGDPERQAREAALLGQLDHPHLVRLHEVVHQPSRGGVPRVALVLDLLAGGSLAALLAQRGRLRPGEVVTALAPVAAALACAHEHGVVHGDLSPGNVVFTAEGRPVLTDLGVARVLGEAAAGEVTPAYVDPTVARGGAPGPASDVFGVAAAAFHALTGIPPWNAADPGGTLRVAASGVLPELEELAPAAPAELLAVVRRGLSGEPAERGTAAAFALDLRHACRPEPVRLPVAGVAVEELARTGFGPRTELTHQVPGGQGPGEEPPEEPPRRRLPRLPARLRLPRRMGWALAVAALGVAVLMAWAGAHGTGGSPAAGPPAVAPAVSAAASRGPSSAPAPTTTQATTPPPAAAPSGGPPAGVADRQATPGSPAEWQQLVTDLYARRAHALTARSSAVLDDVYAPRSAPLLADQREISSLVGAGEELRGFAPMVSAVSGVTVTEGRAELRLVDRWPAYALVPAAEPDGSVATPVPGRGDGGVRVALVRTAAGWRIERAERLP